MKLKYWHAAIVMLAAVLVASVLAQEEPTVEEMLQELVDQVVALNLHEGISNSLDAKLDAALDALDDVNDNNDVAAINSLEAFINAVEAQRGKKISDADADYLIAAAKDIIAKLSACPGCGENPCIPPCGGV